MDSSVRQYTRTYSIAAFSALFFLVLSDVPAISADTGAYQTPADQTNAGVLIPTEAPKTNFVINQSFSGQPLQYYANQAARSFDASTQNLRTNLDILASLNTTENREKLNNFGATYGNLPALGTDLFSAFDAEKLSALSGTANELNTQMGKMFVDYSQILKGVTLDKSLPKDQQIAALENSHLPNAANVLIFSGMANNNISALNANLESLAKTYRNLLQMSTQSPSSLVGISNLAPQLNALDNLAGQMGTGLSDVADTLSASKDSIDSFQNSGGFKMLSDPDTEKSNAADKALGKLDDSLNGLSGKTLAVNAAAGQTLGDGGNAVSVYDATGILASYAENKKANAEAVKKPDSAHSAATGAR